MAGLDDELRTLDRENYRGRDEAYKRSRLSLTDSANPFSHEKKTSAATIRSIAGGVARG
jgi:hypothetical protein